jgi:hypothetical protein
MSGDVTLSADVAREMAQAWRAYAVGDVIQTSAEVNAWADLLDPRPVSLRDEVADRLLAAHEGMTPKNARLLTDAVLAVVKARIEAIATAHTDLPGCPDRLADDYRADVLALFGDDR